MIRVRVDITVLVSEDEVSVGDLGMEVRSLHMPSSFLVRFVRVFVTSPML